jgi:hypothetical protein
MIYFCGFSWVGKLGLFLFHLEWRQKSLSMALDTIYMVMISKFTPELQGPISDLEQSWPTPQTHHIENGTLNFFLVKSCLSVFPSRKRSPWCSVRWPWSCSLFLSFSHIQYQNSSNSFWLDLQMYLKSETLSLLLILVRELSLPTWTSVIAS